MTESPTDPHSSTAEPVCPRHPNRVSYVRCQRCERPVCPECQRPAPVGIQCVDCVREASKQTRQVRTVFGGAVSDGRPLATYTLIGVCVVVFLIQKAVPDFTDKLEFAPYAASHRPWTFLTAAFLHDPSNYLHILFNMYALWICGQYLEPLLGRVRFVALYLVSALGGSVGYLLLAPPTLPTQGGANAWWTATVGASGAVFGLFAALVILNRKLGRSSAGVFAVIIINAVIGFLPGSDIAWQAHLGGLVTGALVAAVLVFAPRERRAVAQWAGLAGVLVLLLVLTAIKFQTVPADVQLQASVFLGIG